eukprot:TRINITY_DN64565_c0_g1_i1.p1 TRINITY_DN64565_c0_g1~~TRINITY_DN64565_c0_g1_i1.p1  ORF type:complete len:509 (-),score=59.26 TRINITY_DN64565_c0_g1_i1:150-1676(-)
MLRIVSFAGFVACLLFVVSTPLAGKVCKDADDGNNYCIEGQHDRVRDLICSGNKSVEEACHTLRQERRISLRPGEAYVVDDFLNVTELRLMKKIMGKLLQNNRDERHYLNTSWLQWDSVPSGWSTFVESVYSRIHGHAVANIDSQSAIKEQGWAYQGMYYPDMYSLRRYEKVSKMSVHPDTGAFGRCLSAGLHVGKCEGGDFRTYRCKKGDCTALGWQHDKKYNYIPDFHLHDTNLEKLATVSYKPGRLMFILAETLHDVSRLTKGSRDIFFMWFSCTPTLVNGAALSGHVSMVEHLIDQRASVTAVSGHTSGGQPMHSAASQGHVTLMELLASKRASFTASDEKKRRPLHYSAIGGHSAVAKLLIKQQADVEQSDIDGVRPMHLAAQYGHAGVLTFLSKAGASVSPRTPSGGQPVHTAAFFENVAVLAALPRLGASVLAVDDVGRQPLHLAAFRGHIKAVQLLMGLRADKSAKDKQGATPIHYAASQNHSAVLKLLLSTVTRARKEL